MSLKRLARELADIKKDASLTHICTAEPADNTNLFVWHATLKGPGGTPYEGGTFLMRLQFPTDYPFKPPKVTMLTKCFHPNINNSGGICCDILSKSWSPVLTVSKVLISLSSLLADPNPMDPLVPDIAQLYRSDHQKYVATAKEWTKRYATSAQSSFPDPL